MATKPLVPSLTGLRFYAAGMVVWNHTADSFGTVLNKTVGETATTGFVGMTLFFVLSGFVIHYNYGDLLASWRPRAAWEFLALLIDLGFSEHWPFSEQRFWFALPYYATLTQDWLPLTFDNRLLTILYLGAAWSISAEVLLYLSYFLLLWPMRWLRTTRAIFAAIAALCVVATVVTYVRASAWPFAAVDDRWACYLSPYCRMPEFMLGVLTAALFVTRHQLPARTWERALCKGLAIVGLIAIAALFWAGLVQGRGEYFTRWQWSWGYAPSCAAIIYCLARVEIRWSYVAAAPAVVMLGDASYSIYFLHGWFIWMFNRGDLADGRLLAFKIAVAWTLIVIVSLGVYHCFEAPARRLIRAALAGRTKGEKPDLATAPAE
jgi:peptidoglycan/LPS O-acetylase OafA/YrhL